MSDWLQANLKLRAARDAMDEHKRVVKQFGLTQEQACEACAKPQANHRFRPSDTGDAIMAFWGAPVLPAPGDNVDFIRGARP